MKEYIIKVNFKNGTIYTDKDIALVQNDYNSTKLKFEFVEDTNNSTKKFRLIYPDSTIWEQEIINNELVLADKNKNNEIVSVLRNAGKYFFEVSQYLNNSKLTTTLKGMMNVRESEEGTDITLDDRVPILDELINKTNNIDIDLNDTTVKITRKDGSTKEQNVKGEPGYSPVARFSKTGKTATFTVTDESGTSSCKIYDGLDGKTPVKGTDYFTNDEISEVTKEIQDAIVLPKKLSELTDDIKTARTNTNNNFSVSQTVNGTLTVNGDIVQNGKLYETHAEEIYTKKNLIKTREGALSGLADDEFTGIEAINYDGENNGRLVFDNSGVARVGDVGDEQPLLTRDEATNLSNNQVLVWDSQNQKAKSSNEYIKSTEIDKKISNAIKPASQTQLGVLKMWTTTNSDGEVTLNISTEA